MNPQEVPLDDLPESVSPSGPQEVPPEDLPASLVSQSTSNEVPVHDLPQEALQDKYSSTGQQALTGLEGLARGATAGLSDALAVGMRKGASALGVPEEDLHYIAPNPEDIAARKEANPIESGASEIAGNVALTRNLPQIGSKAINGLIQMGIISGGDELSKAMLGTGDPTPAVASHIATSGAIGLLTGALFGKVEKGANLALKMAENNKLGTKLLSFISGAGHAASVPVEEELPRASLALKQMANIPEDVHGPSFRMGQSFYNTMAGRATTKGMKYLADLASIKSGGGMLDLAKTHALGMVAENILNKVIPKASQKVIGPAILKAATSNSMENLSQVIDHATSCAEGAEKISRGVEALFNSGANKALEFQNSERNRDKLREIIENGGVQSQLMEQSPDQTVSYAEGGQVDNEQQNPVSKLWPEQNVLISATRGRVSNFLNSARPLAPINKAPYDSDHKDKQKEKDYSQVLDLANQPLSILKHVKDGSLVPKQVVALKAMYPELHGHLSKKITEQIVKHKMKDTKKPPYKTRQALSLFLGNNMDSSLSQPNIMAAQSVFMQQRAQQSQVPKKESALSKMGEHAMTDDQSRERRLNKN